MKKRLYGIDRYRAEGRRAAAFAFAAAMTVSVALPAFAAGGQAKPWEKSAADQEAKADYSSVIFVPLEEIPLTFADDDQTERDAEALAKMLWGEARGVRSTTEKAACVWVVLNRVDDPRWPSDVTEVLSQKYQFGGYSSDNPVDDGLYALAIDVLARHEAEKNGDTNAGRVIPADYFFWCGDSRAEHNWFWQEFETRDYYQWTMETPYED